ncbi:MAG: dUTP diphosphatase [Alphaproteobacteria bacterium]|nr:dUTP diphosphatase [Alphaproteobacteria bacterium]MBL6776366.1 dUTP diphosphatase [Alphaproteobacteria bacterium]
MSVKVSFQKLPHAQDLPLPAYESAGAAGADIRAALPDGPLSLAPMARIAIPTGLAMSLPAGYEAQIRPRSGLAIKQGLSLVNTPGTIDSDYRGEIKVIAVNLGDTPIEITHGMRIAQMVIAPVIQAEFEETKTLDDTERGSAGFGSTGA